MKTCIINNKKDFPIGKEMKNGYVSGFDATRLKRVALTHFLRSTVQRQLHAPVLCMLNVT